MLAKYGFLYTNYTQRRPYWETTEMLRKFAIAFIPVNVGVRFRCRLLWQEQWLG